MSITTTPHLNFRGQAKEALTFYQSVFGGEITIVTYKDAHAVQIEQEADQVMWGQVISRDGFHIMAYDVPSSLAYNEGIIPVFVSVSGSDAAELKDYWAGLSEGAEIVHPLSPSGWSPLYGMIRDRFGITWVLDIKASD